MRKKLICVLLLLILCFTISSACRDSKKHERNGELESDTTFGTFYSLQNAFDLNLITRKDIQQISEMHTQHEFVFLSEDETVRIKKSYLKYYPRDDVQIGYESVVIKESLGKYNDCYALLLHYNDIGVPEVVGFEMIAGITIGYGNDWRIEIYKE